MGIVTGESLESIGKRRLGQRFHAQPLSKAEVSSLIAACTGGPLGLRNKAGIALLGMVGLRVGELTGLTCHDINTDARTVRVVGKGQRLRTVGYGDRAAELIGDWLAVRAALPGDKVFCTLQGDKLSTDAVRSLLRRLGAKSGVPNARPHNLRHGWASVIARELHIVQVRDLLGHGSISTTALYLAQIGGDAVEAVRKVDFG